ncbi:MAG: Gfo/Idh/MocA family oxidoreductase [Pirellulales bacterium]|nr:Gfo/Idh/MocA family oxidoreductase [Pirellulales bacterium]
MYDPVSRREFIRQALIAGAATSAAGAALGATRRPALAREKSANGRLNIGVIGVAAQGEYNLNSVASQNIVALCDIDAMRLAGAAARFPDAKQYKDYRKLLEQKDLDAVVIATPDHSHAIPAVWALRRGLDVYCEKPLAHSVWEVRQLREAAAANKAVTQMGTQIHAGDNYRRVVELVWSGAIGPVRRVHVWQGNAVRPGKRVKEGTPPAYVDYDLWLGAAPYRPFHESHFHFNWRYWWDFGGGILADMGCHYIDLPYWALDLRYPTAVEAQGEKGYEGDNNVPGHLQADYYFPARSTPRGEQPEVKLTWYHGNRMPEGAEQYKKGAAVLFEGDRGRLLADYGTNQLFMNDGQTAETPPATIPSSIGHHAEWIEACKSRGPTTCNFDYSGALAETVLLGNVSYRAGQKRLEWDAEKLTATNCPEAAQYLRREYREGWTL